jgi:hypothetical protein
VRWHVSIFFAFIPIILLFFAVFSVLRCGRESSSLENTKKSSVDASTFFTRRRKRGIPLLVLLTIVVSLRSFGLNLKSSLRPGRVITKKKAQKANKQITKGAQCSGQRLGLRCHRPLFFYAQCGASPTLSENSRDYVCVHVRICLCGAVRVFFYISNFLRRALMMPATSPWYQGLAPTTWGSQAPAASRVRLPVNWRGRQVQVGPSLMKLAVMFTL